MPVTYFVDGSTTAVVMLKGAARHRGGEDVTAIVEVVINRAGAVDIGVWKGAEAEEIWRR